MIERVDDGSVPNLRGQLLPHKNIVNEAPRDWGNFRYIENLDIKNLRKNKQNVRYIEV